MIINRIRAENLLKYVRLELDDLPERGLIAVIGHNESGKSSIGESICFALFGRTFSLELDDLDKVIRWGESRCSVRLDFTTPDGQGYQIARFLDARGNHSASISRIGEEPMVRGLEETAAALKEIIGFGYTELIESFYLAQREITTPNPHSAAVKVMAGVDALERVSANCRDEIEETSKQVEELRIQRKDIDARIKALGFDIERLAELEDDQAACAAKLGEDRSLISQLKTVCEHNETSVSSMKDAEGNWLSVSRQASLRERHRQSQVLAGMVSGLEPLYGRDGLTAKPFSFLSEFARDFDHRVGSIQALCDQADQYRLRLAGLLGLEPSVTASKQPSVGDDNPVDRPFGERRAMLDEQKRDVAHARKWARLGAALLLLPTLATAGLALLLGLFPDAPQAQSVSAWLGLPAGGNTALVLLLPYLAAVLGIGAGGLLWYGHGLSERIAKIQRQSTGVTEEEVAAEEDYGCLRDLDRIPLADTFNRLQGLGDGALVERTATLRPSAASALLDSEANEGYRKAFRSTVQLLEKGISVMKKSATEEIERLQEAVAEQTGALARLGGMLEREHERKRHHDELEAITQSLSARIDEGSHQIRVRELSIDLLGGAVHYISQRFNTEIRNLAADALPKFTTGRYEHLQIDDDLKVKAFSNEKRNFMELDEISSGTQRQIMLAVRLALSQKLVNSVIQGPQMLFLDEPFAFFDEERTASALAVLPQVSGDFTQIWATSQTFPAQSRFDLYIECDTAQAISPRVWRHGEQAPG